MMMEGNNNSANNIAAMTTTGTGSSVVDENSNHHHPMEQNTTWNDVVATTPDNEMMEGNDDSTNNNNISAMTTTGTCISIVDENSNHHHPMEQNTTWNAVVDTLATTPDNEMMEGNDDSTNNHKATMMTDGTISSSTVDGSPNRHDPTAITSTTSINSSNSNNKMNVVDDDDNEKNESAMTDTTQTGKLDTATLIQPTNTTPTTTTTTATTTTVSTISTFTNSYVYILSKEYAWIPGKLKHAIDDYDATTKTEKGTRMTAVVSVPIYEREHDIGISTTGSSAINPATKASSAAAGLTATTKNAVMDWYKKSKKQKPTRGGVGTSTLTNNKIVRYEEVTVQLHDYPNYQLPLQNVNSDGIIQSVPDMVDLPFLHEAAILYNLKDRYMKHMPYTRTGDIIIAMNPYQWFTHLYSEDVRYQYASQLVWGDPACSSSTSSTDQSSMDDSTTTKNGNVVVADPRTLLEPHVYETSSLAYRGLAYDRMNQSILVSGESGAGKTETVKILLSDIASIQELHHNQQISSSSSTSGISRTSSTSDHQVSSSSSSSSSIIVQRILDSNPLLEAFGNAKTIRNDNSSRFGKYIQLQFHMDRTTCSEDDDDPSNPNHYPYHNGFGIHPCCTLAGSHCEVYLLEKSRVVSHSYADERTFHIFYQLLSTNDSIKQLIWDGLVNTDCESFTYVGYTDTHCIEGLSDEERFHNTIQTLELLGLSHDVIYGTLFQTLCIVLQLGNIIFESKKTITTTPAPASNNYDTDALTPYEHDDDVDDDEEDDHSKKTNPAMISSLTQKEVVELTELMGLSTDHVDELVQVLTHRTIHARNESFSVPLTVETAKESIDAFAKDLYYKTFLWLVRQMNDATCAELNDTYPNTSSTTAYHTTGSTHHHHSDHQSSSSSLTDKNNTTKRRPPQQKQQQHHHQQQERRYHPTPSSIQTTTKTTMKYGTIGLLDIFGFESFGTNRFEQLCINYANEKLQQKFTYDIFRSVQAEYEQEGLDLDEILYHRPSKQRPKQR